MSYSQWPRWRIWKRLDRGRVCKSHSTERSRRQISEGSDRQNTRARMRSLYKCIYRRGWRKETWIYGILKAENVEEKSHQEKIQQKSFIPSALPMNIPSVLPVQHHIAHSLLEIHVAFFFFLLLHQFLFILSLLCLTVLRYSSSLFYFFSLQLNFLLKNFMFIENIF